MLGWQLLCEWKDGSTKWVAQKGARQSYPVLVAEYAIANRINDEPAFAWWIHDVIKKRDRIIAKVKSKILATDTQVRNQDTKDSSRSN